MSSNDITRLSRQMAILPELPTRRLLTATELAEKFSVSIRTVYCDIIALAPAGVPILTEDPVSGIVWRHPYTRLRISN